MMTLPSNRPARSTRVQYADVFCGAVAALVVLRALTAAMDPSWTWSTPAVLAVAGFSATLAALVWARMRAPGTQTAWVRIAFAMCAAWAIAVLFWPLHVLWFAAALCGGGAALICALVMGELGLREPVSREVGFKLAAVALGVVLCGAALELTLRVVPGIVGPALRPAIAADPSQYGVPNPYIGYLHRPNGAVSIRGKDFAVVHRVDSRGFRNPEPWPAHADIVTVGDSVTFGYGADTEQAWPALLRRELPAAVVNIALIGAGPQQYLRLYETFGVALRPKLLVVGVFAANDFWDADAFDEWLRSGGVGNYMVWRDFGRPGPITFDPAHPGATMKALFNRTAYPVMRRSRVYNLLRALHNGWDSGSGEPPVYVDFADGSRLRLLPGDLRSKTESATSGAHAFRLALDALLEIQTIAAKNGTGVLMVLQPSKEEVYLPLLHREAPDPTRALREAFDARGIEYLDLAPDFRRRAAAGERLFFEDDGHPNPKGYALIGEAVRAHIASEAARYGLGDFRRTGDRVATADPAEGHR